MKEGYGVVVTVTIVSAAVELVLSHLLHDQLVPFQARGWMLPLSYVAVLLAFVLFHAKHHSVASGDYDSVGHREARPRASLVAFFAFGLVGFIALARATMFWCFTGYGDEVDCYVVGLWPTEAWSQAHPGLGRRESMALAHFDAQEVYGVQYIVVLVSYVLAYLALLVSVVWWSGKLFLAEAGKGSGA